MNDSKALEWYERPMRIGALQCDFEGGEKETISVIGKWADMGMNVEQLFHPTADLYSALFDKAAHGPLLSRFYAVASHQGAADC